MRGIKHFTKLLEEVLIADKIGLNGGHLSRIFLWVLQRPYKTPKLETLGLKIFKLSLLEQVGGAFRTTSNVDDGTFCKNSWQR